MEAKKNILIIIGDKDFNFDNPNSAVVNYLKTLGENLLSNGHSVNYWPLPKIKSISEGQELNQSKNLSLTLKYLVKKIFKKFYAALILKKKLVGADEASSEVLTYKCDLVIEFLTIGSNVGHNYKKKTGAKHLVIFDSPLLEQFEDMHAFPLWYGKEAIARERESLVGADKIIAYANSTITYLKNNFGLDENKLSQLPCIIWKDEINVQINKEQTIGFIGSFLSWHKVNLLVKAFENIAVDFPRAKLILIGKGEEWSKIKSQLEKSNFKTRIDLLGFVSELELKSLKEKMLIGVMPGSNWYGCPLKLFEYAESEIAIIAPSTPVVLDLFTSNEVLFIEPKNELVSLTNCLRILLSDEKKRNQLILKAKNKMLNDYSKSSQMNNFNALINKIS